MSRFFVHALALATSLVVGSAFAQSPSLQETWEKGYQNKDATGPHVLGYWKFDAEDPVIDSSGNGNGLTLQGAVSVPDGKFGAAIEGFPGFPVEDKRHAAVTAPKPNLSPKSAFTLEMWIKPKAEFTNKLRCYLLDKKYTDHADYQWQIGEATQSGQRHMTVNLGFGGETQAIHSLPFMLVTDVWQHVAFTYDGKGEGRFYLNGESIGGMKLSGYGAIIAGIKPLSIGDRIGSNYGGFPGFIDEVRICDGVLNFEQVRLQILSDRAVWRRMETIRPIEIVCTNQRRELLKAASLKINVAGKEESYIVPDLAPGQKFTAKYSLNSAFKAQQYVLTARVEVTQPKPYSTEEKETFQIVARIPERMPVVMWGSNPKDATLLRDIGFTHCIGIRADTSPIWQAKAPVPPAKPDEIATNRHMLDAALAADLNVVASLTPSRVLIDDPANLRVDRAGVPNKRKDICASIPEFAPFFENVGKSVAKAYGDHPAFDSVLVSSEVRDDSSPSFNPIDVENYRKFANADIPPGTTNRWGVHWSKIKDFPADRVIADDDPVLKYYRWFWTVGDGWNNLHSALSKGAKSAGRRDLWTFFDPAVRQPSISGAGGNVDVLSHWTYTYPDPQRIGLCTDQLAAMSTASGRNQKIMKMTQIIWYRSQTAPTTAAARATNPVAWEDYDPDAAYITIAPMHLKEALWTKISRPIQGIMYHGWESLIDIPSNNGAYRFTNGNTAPVLKDLLHQVIEPLGPTLMAIPDERSEVAFFESFTSQMFASRGGYGNNTDWAADVWLALQHAHVQTDILYEETLLNKGGLNGRKVLVMPYCDVLTKSLVARIQEWQKRGGKIVADEFLCPALKADVVLPSFKRVKKGDLDKQKVLEMAKTLETQVLPQRVQCDNPEIIVRTRRFGDALYVFAVNDRREFGTYVGQHGLVMENGLPSTGTLGLSQEQANVYDLTRTSFIVPQRTEAQGIRWPLKLGPCDGRIFMVTTKPLLGLKLEIPETATVGNSVKVQAVVTTTDDAPIKAILPVHVEIRDANSKLTEGTGYYAAKNGTLDLTLDLAPNEDPGTWEIHIKELASGMESTKWMQVRLTAPAAGVENKAEQGKQ